MYTTVERVELPRSGSVLRNYSEGKPIALRLGIMAGQGLENAGLPIPDVSILVHSVPGIQVRSSPNAVRRISSIELTAITPSSCDMI